MLLQYPIMMNSIVKPKGLKVISMKRDRKEAANLLKLALRGI
jgi:hypothetical protein